MSPAPRQAVVLAAGRGSRLGAAAQGRPKCLAPLAGRPVLDWTLEALRATGIEQVMLVGGWQSQALQGRADRLVVNDRWQETNMVASLRLAGEWLEAAPTLMVYGDGAYGPTALRSALQPRAESIVVPVDRQWAALWRQRFADPLEDAETLRVRDGRLVDIGRRPSAWTEIEAQFMGLVRWTPAGWAQALALLHGRERCGGAAVNDRLDMTGLLRALVEDGVAVGTVPVDGGWVEIDAPGDLRGAEEGLREPGCLHDFRR